MQKVLENVKSTHKRAVEIENGDVRRYAEAIFATDPIHNDLNAAKKAGFTGLVAPPTFCASLGVANHSEILAELELNPRQVLHSEQQLSELEQVCSGDVLNVTSTLVDRYERATGSTNMGFVIIEDVGTNQKGKKVFLARRVLAVRGGFPRR
ncbi:MAG: MaoC family dehydratase N-terminal domain-containing protein [Myxococcota bacterium]